MHLFSDNLINYQLPQIATKLGHGKSRTHYFRTSLNAQTNHQRTGKTLSGSIGLAFKRTS